MANKVTFNSSDYVGKDGRNLSLTLEEVEVSDSNNSSKIKWTLNTSGGDVTYYDTYCYIEINGSKVFFSNGRFSAAGYSGWIGSANHPTDTQAWIDAPGNEYTCAKWGYTTGGTTGAITHNADGNKSVTVKFLVGCFYYVVKDCGGSFKLSKTDRTPPVITQFKPSNITHNSCTIAAKAELNKAPVECSKWWYRKRKVGYNWDSWIEINESADHKNITVSGLDPNTEYEFQWCGRRKSNGVDGYSGTEIIKTLGASILNNFSNVYLDVPSPKMHFNTTVYATEFYHRLVLSKDDKSMTFDIGRSERVGNVNFDLSLSPAQSIALIMDWIGSTRLVCDGVSATLTTYTDNNYSTPIGEPSSISGIKLILRKENVQPTLTVGGYVSDYTDNNQYVVPGVSKLRLNNVVASSKYGAYIDILNVVQINADTRGTSTTQQLISQQVSSYNASPALTWGGSSQTAISQNCSGFIKVVLRDSRGFTVTVPIMLKIHRPGALIKAEDYDFWYDTLKSHFFVRDVEGNYIMTGDDTVTGFTMRERNTAI